MFLHYATWKIKAFPPIIKLQQVGVIMKIGFLIIGSEVLNGIVNDLNLKILADFLNSHNLEIHETLICRDHASSIKNDFDRLIKNNDLVITTGGLGPTLDDITKRTLADHFAAKVIYSDKAYQVAIKNYERMGRAVPTKEHEYAQFPENFIPLNNNAGNAPGIYIAEDGKFVLCAPGVPREFKAILEEHFLNLFQNQVNKADFQEIIFIRTKGIPEEKIFYELDLSLWEKLEEIGVVSSLPVMIGVNIGVKITGRNHQEIIQKTKRINEVVHSSPLKQYVWNIGFQKLEEKILEITNSRGIKFGFAESATGGLCSSRITNISGSSASFMGGIVCYDENVKEHILGVSRKTLDTYSAVSLECAEEMAAGLLKKLNLDLAISITGYAGPNGGSDKFPVGSVCIGWAKKGSPPKSQSLHFRGDRIRLKEIFSEAALFTLLRELEDIS